jgi:rRNA-processing protein EBP2
LQVREVLLKKQHVQERTEHVRQLRQLRKVGKRVQKEAKVRQADEKRKMLEEVKKYRKGLRTDLDFLEEKKTKPKPTPSQGNRKGPMDKK